MKLKFKKIVDYTVCSISHWKNSTEFNRIRNENGEYSLKGYDQLQCIYVHIPKAAGISINKALFGHYGGGHKTVRVYKRIFGPKLFNSYFKFTFVRNPYSRLFSAYHFLKEGGFNEENRIWYQKNLSEYKTFDEFVRNWIDRENIWSFIHFKPQYSFVCDIDRQPEVDFIGRVESIYEDFNYICNKLKIENKLSRLNTGKLNNSNWPDYYTSDTLAKVYNLYKYDFEIFGYDRLT